jgi:NAD(P)H-dependent FMN reductase
MEFTVVEGTVRDGRKSIHAARELVSRLEQRGHEAELYDPKGREIPMMRTRTYTDPGEPPENVQEFSSMVESCDCLVLVTPEYNHSYTGALKNLIDHLYPEYDGKPFGFVTVSGGGFGGVRAQKDLNELALTLGGHPGPSLPVSRIGEKFDNGGELVDEQLGDRFEEFVDKLEDHARFVERGNSG